MSDTKTPMDYVLGCALDDRERSVVVIQKQKPDWQKGKWNLIGGKIEPTDESPVAAMAREFKEETDVDIPALHWYDLATVKARYGNMHVFYTTDYKVHLARTVEEEIVMVRPIEQVLADDLTLPSLKFYIPLVLERHRGLLLPVYLEYKSVY